MVRLLFLYLSHMIQKCKHTDTFITKFDENWYVCDHCGEEAVIPDENPNEYEPDMECAHYPEQ